MADVPRERGGLIAGSIIIAIGVFLLLGQVVPDIGQWVPLAVGLLFLLGFVVRREYGLLVAGCIISGVGVGVVLEDMVHAPWSGAAVVLSLAGGFVAIWVIDTLLHSGQRVRRSDGRPATRAGWWPLVPGGILALVGIVSLAEQGLDSDIVRWWPVLLVAAGLVVLWNSRSGRGARRGP